MARASGGTVDRKEASLWLVSMFFAGAGFFASGPVLELIGGGDPTSRSLLQRQHRVMSSLEDALRERMNARRSVSRAPTRPRRKERG